MHCNALRILREQLDLPNLAPQMLGTGANDYYHALGRKVYTYMRPNTEGQPESSRRVYGLALWQMGYDEAMPWIWTRSPWRYEQGDNWDRKMWVYMQWRSADGFIATIKSEAWRAAVDDVRYLTALLQAIEQAKITGHTEAAGQAQQYVEALRNAPPWDFEGLRYEIARHTAELHGLLQ